MSALDHLGWILVRHYDIAAKVAALATTVKLPVPPSGSAAVMWTSLLTTAAANDLVGAIVKKAHADHFTDASFGWLLRKAHDEYRRMFLIRGIVTVLLGAACGFAAAGAFLRPASSWSAVESDFDAFGISYHVYKGHVQRCDELYRLTGEADIQTQRDYTEGSLLRFQARASHWKPDTTVGFEKWYDSNRLSIRFEDGRLRIEGQGAAPASVPIQDWEELRNRPITFELRWFARRVELAADGVVVASHDGPSIPNAPLKVRMHAAANDEMKLLGGQIGLRYSCRTTFTNADIGCIIAPSQCDHHFAESGRVRPREDHRQRNGEPASG